MNLMKSLSSYSTPKAQPSSILAINIYQQKKKHQAEFGFLGMQYNSQKCHLYYLRFQRCIVQKRNFRQQQLLHSFVNLISYVNKKKIKIRTYSCLRHGYTNQFLNFGQKFFAFLLTTLTQPVEIFAWNISNSTSKHLCQLVDIKRMSIDQRNNVKLQIEMGR